MPQLARIRFTQEAPPPVISSATVSVVGGTGSLTVAYAATAQAGVGGLVTFKWFFGDGTTANGASGVKTYAVAGLYSAYLVVNDSSLSTTSGSLAVIVGTRPEIVIEYPANGSGFVAGQVVSFRARVDAGSNSENATLAVRRVYWNLIVQHGTQAGMHFHNEEQELPGLELEFTAPDSGHPFHYDVFLIAEAVVEMESGITSRTSIRLVPTEVMISFTSTPPGIPFQLDSLTEITPFTVDSLVGFYHHLQALPLVCSNGILYKFANWSVSSSTDITVKVPSFVRKKKKRKKWRK